MAASAARISTQQGTAMEMFEGSRGDERDLKLIGKVLSSGHKSVIEHQTFSVAFNDVSVLVEQFVIECRLASFTVKSRRYVDFAGAGFVVPDGLDEARERLYRETMQARFADYERLLALGVPKEDARFLLPYCLRSNFFMTLNARELIGLICAMLYGRGKGMTEVEALGAQLKEQFDALYPGVIEREATRYPECAPMALPETIRQGTAREGDAELLNAFEEAAGFLKEMCAFTGRLDGDIIALLTDARPRELEMVRYTFRVKRVSLACVTHFTRHRMVSLLVPPVVRAMAEGDFVLPETVKAIPEAEAVYRAAFEAQARAARQARDMGISMQALSYFALSGHEIELVLAMNLRELAHFMRLRTCNRAQWEIRGVAWKMLKLLCGKEPELFTHIGPSCAYGPCPEGKMSCGKPYKRMRN
ncbi:MAG: FAD-dependent thymidylate synthase [Clostridia bacterium]|nr:FAD-dependent thymidylate synthase [Clostridia bacterium]